MYSLTRVIYIIRIILLLVRTSLLPPYCGVEG